MDYLIMLPIIIAIAVFIALVFKKTKTENHYDERQLIARSNAYKYAFFALLFYFYAGEFFTMMREAEWCTPECNLGLGLLISIGTFVIFAIAKDAYRAINAEGKGYIPLVLLGLFMVVTGVLEAVENGIMHNGLLDLPIMLCVGALMVIILISLLIKRLAVRREESEEE